MRQSLEKAVFICRSNWVHMPKYSRGDEAKGPLIRLSTNETGGEMKRVLALCGISLALVACDGSSSSSGDSVSVTVKGAGLATSASGKVFRVSDPANLKLKVYKFAVSASGDCSDPITVYENDSPDYEDFLSNPTIGSGDLDEGSYPCIIFEFSDIIKFTPEENDGDYCVADQEEELEVCKINGEEDPGTTFMLADGTTGTCSNGEQRVAMYISTYSSSTGGDGNNNAFMPPESDGDATQGLNLGAAFVVSGSTVATFVVDGTGQVNNGGDNASCDMQPPTFTFEFN